MNVIRKSIRMVRRRVRNFIGTENLEYLIEPLYDRISVITDIYLPALIHHQEVFPKYKNINKGKTVVIVGTGPTLECYEPILEALHIAINYAVRCSNIKFDYCFYSDYDAKGAPDFLNEILSYGNGIVSFFGMNYQRANALIPEIICERDNVEWYYVDCYDWGAFGENFDKMGKFFYPLDLSVSPLKAYGTTMFSAFQFALWSHPDKIYLVGADCSVGHANAIGYTSKAEENDDFSYLISAWRKSKEFAQAYYPDIKIVSLNPVGLKGVFEDEYTDSYIKKYENAEL